MIDLFLRSSVQDDPTLATQYPGVKLPFIWAEGQNDLQVDVSSDLRTLGGTDRLIQDVVKILITQRGTNSELPLYGSNLQGLIGQKMEPSFLQGQIVNEVTDCLLILQALNQFNPDTDQQIQTLQSIQVDLSSPTQLTVSFIIVTVSGKTVGSSAVITQ